MSGYAYAKVFDANEDEPDLYLITSAAHLKERAARGHFWMRG